MVKEGYPDPWASGKYNADDDVSLFDKASDDRYEFHSNALMFTWAIYREEDGLWHWTLTNHDAWDGQALYDEIIDGSETGLPTWLDVARLLNKTQKFW